MHSNPGFSQHFQLKSQSGHSENLNFLKFLKNHKLYIIFTSYEIWQSYEISMFIITQIVHDFSVIYPIFLLLLHCLNVILVAIFIVNHLYHRNNFFADEKYIICIFRKQHSENGYLMFSFVSYEQLTCNYTLVGFVLYCFLLVEI